MVSKVKQQYREWLPQKEKLTNIVLSLGKIRWGRGGGGGGGETRNNGVASLTKLWMYSDIGRVIC